VSKKISTQWKALDDRAKAKYEAMSNKDKARYALEKESYVPTQGFGSDGKALAVGKGGKAKRAKKDKNLPKGALSSYIIFCTQMRSVIKTETPGMPIALLYPPLHPAHFFLSLSFLSCRHRQHGHHEADW
jgi:hypothetical protein